MFENVTKEEKEALLNGIGKVKSRKIILTLGTSHYVLPINNITYSNNIANVTLTDETKIETSVNNVILVTDSSKIIESILKSNTEKFYKPDECNHGTVLIKKIDNDFYGRGEK